MCILNKAQKIYEGSTGVSKYQPLVLYMTFTYINLYKTYKNMEICIRYSMLLQTKNLRLREMK